MVNYCAVVDCYSCSKFKSDVRFFRFPKDDVVCNSWIKACGKKNVNLKYERVCSLHFTKDDWCLKHKLLDVPLSEKRLDPKAIPTQNLPEMCIDKPLRNQIVRKKNRNEITENCYIQNFEQRFLKEHDTSRFLEEDVPVENCMLNHSDETHLSQKSKHIAGAAYYVVLDQCNEPQINFTPNYHKNSSPKELSEKSHLYRCDEHVVFSHKHRISELIKQLQECQKENERISFECSRLRFMETSIKSIFTEGQVKKLINPKSKLIWTLDEIASAIQLYSFNPRSYQYLYKKNYPFPRPSILRLWTPRIKIKSATSIGKECENKKS